MTAPESQDLTQAPPAGQAVPQPDADRDRQSTLEAAANPSNTPVADPGTAEPGTADPAGADPAGDR